MKKFFTDILTQNDNRTWCIGRVSLFLGALSFIALGFIHAILNHSMDFSAFGMGLGALIGGSGVYVGAQSATDKNVENSSQ